MSEDRFPSTSAGCEVPEGEKTGGTPLPGMNAGTLPAPHSTKLLVAPPPGEDAGATRKLPGEDAGATRKLPGEDAGATRAVPGTGAGATSGARGRPLRPLMAMKLFLRGYSILGGPAWLRPPRYFFTLASLYFGLFLSESYVSTLLCRVLPGFILAALAQRKRRKPAAGGWEHPNLFTPADLKQEPADIEALRRLPTITLCELLGQELRLLLRLLRAAIRAYQNPKMEMLWDDRHRAVTLVLVRVLQIGARLRERGSHFLAEECARWELMRLWYDQFGENLPPPGWVHRLMRPQEEIKGWGQRRMLKHLLEEQSLGRPIPPALADFFAAWQRGELAIRVSPRPPEMLLRQWL